MNKVVIAAIVGAAACLAVAAVYFGAPYAGVRLSPAGVVAVAAVLAFGVSVAAFTLLALNRTPAGRAYASTKLNEDPVQRFVALFKEPGTIRIVAVPGIPADIMLMRYGRVFEHPDQYTDKKVFLTIKKAKREVFNPVVLRALFEKLKPFVKSEHVLLVNEYGEYIGAIPFARAVKEFTGENAETKISKSIVSVLANPESKDSIAALRALNGMGVNDFISDHADIHEAAKMTWDDQPLHGLVVYSGKRNRKPIGVIDRNAILQLVATGA
jgi:hypothetical protein